MSDPIDPARQHHPMEPVQGSADTIAPDDLSTIPPEQRREEEPMQQCLVRVHKHDHQVLKALLKKDRLSFQKFVGYCVRGYLDADPYMLKFLKLSRQMDAIPADVRDKHILSHRERTQIYDELEELEKGSQS